MTLDPEGNLWFSNVTRHDASDEFAYACAATSIFRFVKRIKKVVSIDHRQGFNFKVCLMWLKPS